jgi:hypothetical protein
MEELALAAKILIALLANNNQDVDGAAEPTLVASTARIILALLSLPSMVAIVIAKMLEQIAQAAITSMDALGALNSPNAWTLREPLEIALSWPIPVLFAAITPLAVLAL